MYAIVYLYYSLRRYYTLIQKWLTKINVLFLGKWSAGPPRCSPIRCVALEILDAHLRVLALNNTYRGLATFLCPFGYRLVGPDSIKCGHEGRWTGSVPSCKGMFTKSSIIIPLLKDVYGVFYVIHFGSIFIVTENSNDFKVVEFQIHTSSSFTWMIALKSDPTFFK